MVKFTAILTHHTSYFLLFRSQKYLYNFGVNGSFINIDSSTLYLRQHNNPFKDETNLWPFGYYGRYIGNHTENIKNVDQYRASGSQTREDKEHLYFMEQKIHSISLLFKIVF